MGRRKEEREGGKEGGKDVRRLLPRPSQRRRGAPHPLKGGREGGREGGRKEGGRGKYLEVLPGSPIREICHLQSEVSARAPSPTPTAIACQQQTDRQTGREGGGGNNGEG